MRIQEEIKKELLKEVYGNIDNIYDFISLRYKLDNLCDDAIIKKLNELKEYIEEVLKIEAVACKRGCGIHK